MAKDIEVSPLQETSDPLSDDRVVSRLRILCRSSKRTEIEIIRLLVILQARHLDLHWTYSSLYQFCAERLGMTEGEATRRVAAARLIRRVPALLEYLRAGQLSMTTLLCLRDYLTVENADELLASVAKKSKREVQLVLAEREPNAGCRSKRRQSSSNEPGGKSSTSSSTRDGKEAYRLEVARSSGLHEKIELARKLMAQNGFCDDFDHVIEAAMDSLLTELRGSGEQKAARTRQVDRLDEPETAPSEKEPSESRLESSGPPLSPSRSRSQLARRHQSAEYSRQAAVGRNDARAPAGTSHPKGAASRISQALHRPLKHRPAPRPRDRAPSGPRASAGSGRTGRARGSD